MAPPIGNALSAFDRISEGSTAEQFRGIDIDT
jgi:hypothetical protein